MMWSPNPDVEALLWDEKGSGNPGLWMSSWKDLHHKDTESGPLLNRDGARAGLMTAQSASAWDDCQRHRLDGLRRCRRRRCKAQPVLK